MNWKQSKPMKINWNQPNLSKWIEIKTKQWKSGHPGKSDVRSQEGGEGRNVHGVESVLKNKK